MALKRLHTRMTIGKLAILLLWASLLPSQAWAEGCDTACESAILKAVIEERDQSAPLITIANAASPADNPVPGRVQRTFCRAYQDNDFRGAHRYLMKWVKRELDRAYTFEELYVFIKCDITRMDSLDILRVSVEEPRDTSGASLEMFNYFRSEAENPYFLSEIVMCKKFIGGQTGSLNILEHIERNLEKAAGNDEVRTNSLKFLRKKILMHMDMYPLGHTSVKCPAFLEPDQ